MDTCQNVLIQQQYEMVFVIGIFIVSILNYNLTNFQVAILDNNSINLTCGVSALRTNLNIQSFNKTQLNWQKLYFHKKF